MDLIKSLIGIFLKIAFGAFFVVLVWWLVSLLFPALSFTSVKQTIWGTEDNRRDLLPSPRKFANLFNLSGTTTQKEHVPYPEWGEGPTNPANAIAYTDGPSAYNQGPSNPANQVAWLSSAQTSSGQQASISNQSIIIGRSEIGTYIRNVSIYEGGSVYPGYSLIGEARNEFFINGGFPVLIVDTKGVVIGRAIATTKATWTVPGWSRFDVKLQYTATTRGPCLLLFEQGLQGYTNKQPVRVGIPVTCN